MICGLAAGSTGGALVAASLATLEYVGWLEGTTGEATGAALCDADDELEIITAAEWRDSADALESTAGGATGTDLRETADELDRTTGTFAGATGTGDKVCVPRELADATTDTGA